MREPEEAPIDEETPGPDRWEQERDLLDEPDDAERPLAAHSPDPASLEADVADALDQSIEVPDEDRRDDAE